MEDHVILLLRRMIASNITDIIFNNGQARHASSYHRALKNESATEFFLIIKKYVKGHKHHQIEFVRNAFHHCIFTQDVDKDIYCP